MGMYWLIGIVIVVCVLGVFAIGEGIRAVARTKKENK